MSLGRDPWVVPVSALGPVVNAWIARHRATHPAKRVWAHTYDPYSGELAPRDAMPGGYPAMTYLAEHTGLTERSIERIRQGGGGHTSLRIADALLTAMGEIHLLHTDVPVVRNPRARASGA